MGKTWNFVKWIDRGCMGETQAMMEDMKEDLKKEWERTHTCKKCKKIFKGEGYPYKKLF